MANDRRSEKRVILYRAGVPGKDDIHEVEYPAVLDALHFACRDFSKGRRHPIEILEDGVQIFDADAIAKECRERQDEMDREHGLA